MDDTLFEDVPYDDSDADDSGLFEDTLHPEMHNRTLASVVDSQNNEAVLNRPDVSPARSALVGAGQSATIGFAEEVTAPFAAAAGMAGVGGELPSLPGESTWDKYQRLMQEYRDVARDEQAGAQEQNPGSYTAGAVAGGIASPGLGLLKGASMAAKGLQAVKVPALIAKAASGAGAGAIGGGAAGLGEAQGSLEERLPQAEETAKMGAGIGAAIPVVGAGLATAGKTAGKIAELPLVKKTIEGFKRGVKDESLVTETGRREASGIGRELAGDLFSDIKKVQSDIGESIEAEINAAHDSGRKLNLESQIEDAFSKLDTIKKEGSKEAASYAAGVESEIKKILKIPKESEFMGVADDALPEGLIVPSAKAVSKEITPKQAQDLKQVLYNYTPKKMMAPQEIAPAGVAKELRSAISSQLNDLTDDLPRLNKEYGIVKDSLKRLNINEKSLPSQIKEKVNRVVARLEDESTSGDDARQLINDVLGDIEKVAPEVAKKYAMPLEDIAQRLKLTKEITKGLQSGLSFGTLQGLTKAGANVAGLVASKLGGAKIGAGIKGVSSFTKDVLQHDLSTKGAIKYKTQGAEALNLASKAVEPYKVQRQVASAAESADPQLLKDQATNIRQQHGKQGEQLATILENMADQSKDTRRALMFTVLQNPMHRKMLGLMDEEKR
jgi:hypothetical protein